MGTSGQVHNCILSHITSTEPRNQIQYSMLLMVPISQSFTLCILFLYMYLLP